MLKPASMAVKMSATPAGVSNTEALGRILYTDYVYYFQIAGLVLLVAMIGAIVFDFAQPSRASAAKVISVPECAHRRRWRWTMPIDLKPGQGAQQEGA